MLLPLNANTALTISFPGIGVRRVHYPLPLMHEDNPEPEALKRTIRRLRDELEDVKGTLQKKLDKTEQKFVDDEGSIRSNVIESAELRRLKIENSRLASQVQSNHSRFHSMLHNLAAAFKAIPRRIDNSGFVMVTVVLHGGFLQGAWYQRFR